MSSFPELQGTLFCDPHFVKNYLSGDPTKLKAVLDRCTTELGSFQFPKATRESELYNPIMSILNTINRAVHADPDWQPAPPAAFVDVHTESLPSHGRDTDDLYPDLVQFDYKGRHWENVRMTVEVKAKATYLKSGMKQLAEYATAVFANQIHRRHLYGLVICKWEVTFVRFDRGGILFSLPMDMCAQREKFCAAFAGLMMLDNQAFGYDMAFWTRRSSRGLLDYYVNLPANAFTHVGGTSAATGMSLEEILSLSTTDAENLSPLMRTVKVIDVLCRDGGIVGKATTVLLVREVIRSRGDGLFQTQKDIEKASRKIRGKQLAERQDVLGAQDYVLKLVWRGPDRTVEGDILQRLVGVYGAAQYMWHSDSFKACDTPGCGRSMDNSCGNCLDKTPTGNGLWAIDNLTDLDITVPTEVEDDEETQYEEVEIDTYRQMDSRHGSRTYCRILMSTVGIPLNSARNLRDFLRAVLDAVLAYWRLVNMGFVHQDISHGNVYMLPQEGHGYHQREWKLPQATIEDSTLAESGRLLRGVLDTLGRDPVGMLGDFDLAKRHNMTNAPLLHNSPSTDVEPKSNDPSQARKLTYKLLHQSLTTKIKRRPSQTK
ncbi:hypothetical protein FRC12_004881 [Ceratobasidium sp. 428]|nr:hypothetical protein FRC12_004881 [Ceratobasidium sp. 428]